MAYLKDDVWKNNDISVQLVCVGSPLLDISAKCSREDLQKYDLKPDDCILAKPEHEALFKILFNSPESRLGAGGSAQNSARIAKWILRERGKVASAGCVGHDDFATWIRNKLLSEGVEPLFVYHSEEGTGVCACLLASSNERSMITRHGAAAHFYPRHLENEIIRRYILNANCIFVEGYFLAHSAGAIFELANMCAPKQMFSISLSAEYICREHAKSLLKLLPRVDILLGNEAEVKIFAQALGAKGECTVGDAAQLIANQQRSSQALPRIVIVSNGPEPVIVAESGKNLKRFRIPPNIPVVDSIGCGDGLAGGFLAEYILTRDLYKAVRMGIQAAVTIAQTEGCQPPLYHTCEPDDSIVMD